MTQSIEAPIAHPPAGCVRELGIIARIATSYLGRRLAADI